MPRINTKWSDIHESRYSALFSYFKNILHLNINKEDYIEKMNKREIFKYIMENDKWADGTKESYLLMVARKLNILKNHRQAKQFSEQGFEFMKSRGDAEGNNQLDEKEKESWRPHQYFIDILNTVKQDGTISITQHMKILLLTLLTYQPPLRTSFYTSALILRTKEDNDKKHNYVYINRRGSTKIQYIVNKDKASNYKQYTMHKNLSFIDVEGEAKKALSESEQNFPRNYLFEINEEPISESTLLRWLREITGVPKITIDIMRSSYITWFYEKHPHFNDREKLGKVMRHSQKTAQLNYNKVFATEHIEDSCREAKKELIVKNQELKALQIQLTAYQQNKPNDLMFKKRRRDALYQMNTKKREPRDITLKKYSISKNSSGVYV